jgi:hypothetical protein
MYCHYEQLAVDGPLQLLARVQDRCAQAKVIGHVNARFGEPVEIPPAHGEMELATFSLSSPLSARIEGVLFKPPQLQLTAWDHGAASPTTYRFVPGTAGDAHVLAVPASLGYSRSFMPPTIRQLQFTGGGWSKGQGAVRVTFLAVPMDR